MVRFAHYLAAHRVKNPEQYDNTVLLAKALSEYGEAELVFRYRHDYFDQANFGKAGTYFIYDNMPPALSEAEVSQIERKYLPPYNVLRLMTNVSRARYPCVEKVFNDQESAQIAASWVRFFNERKPDVFLGGLLDDYVGLVGQAVAERMGIAVILIFSGGVVSGQYTLCGPDYLPLFYKKLSKKEINAGCSKAVRCLVAPEVLNPNIARVYGRYHNLASVKNMCLLLAASLESVKAYYFNPSRPRLEQKLWFSPFELAVRQAKYFIRTLIGGRSFSQMPRKGERYVFFPLHFTNDAAIVMAMPFANQVRMVKEFANLLPHGLKLYIKPHPHWKCADMSLSDIRELSRIPNLRLIRADVNARELIRGSELVVIINSSVGFESLALKKRVFSFGNFYPPDVIPRFANPRDIIGSWDRDLDWKKAEEFLGRMYLHGIRCNEDDFAIGAFNGKVSKSLAKAAYECYQTLLKR